MVPVPLISVLFQRGAFGATDTASTALALAVYGLGLPAFVLQKVLQPLYFAREDTRRPFRYALASLVPERRDRGRPGAVHRLHRRGPRHDAGGLGDGAAALARLAPAWARWREIDARLRRRLPRILVAAARDGRGALVFAALASALARAPAGTALRGPGGAGRCSGIASYFGDRPGDRRVPACRTCAARCARTGPLTAAQRCRTAAITSVQPPGLTTKDSAKPATKRRDFGDDLRPPAALQQREDELQRQQEADQPERRRPAGAATRAACQRMKVKAPISP